MINLNRSLVVAALSAAASVLMSSHLAAQTGTGVLRLTITDEATGAAVPARVEVRDANGDYHVAEDALPSGGDCDMSDLGAGLNDMAAVLEAFSDRIENPYTQSTQFYSGGAASVQLPVGRARVRVFRGPEYHVAVETTEIVAGGEVRMDVALRRWTDMPQRGWYSGDDHLHIPRPDPALNPYISKILQAEDLHVGNLLLMGKVRNFTISPQHAHGPESHYQEDNYILAAGQENPRTHFLGHTITLGAREPINNREKYLIYRLVWEEAARQGALNGFAHGNMPEGGLVTAHEGMAVVMPHDLMSFIEVLQFNRGDYDAWYDVLAMGFRVAPTAGTDYPCVGQNLPGHERFYTRVEGEFNYDNWLDGVRNHRTFVTTGPLAEFTVGGEDIGGEVFLDQPTEVRVAGRVHFDPGQDDVTLVELIQSGEVVAQFPRRGDASTIEFSVERRVEESSWFALRGYGVRVLEAPSVSPMHVGTFAPSSNVHTAPVWVTLRDQPDIARTQHSRAIAQTWLARLERLELALAPENIQALAQRIGAPDFDAVPRDVLLSNRDELLEEIEVAKAFFSELLGR